MRLTELFRTAPFRLAVAFAAALSVCTFLIFAFIYWQTALVETQRLRSGLRAEVEAVARESTNKLIGEVDLRLIRDLHKVTYAALFAPDGSLVAGNLAAVPPGLIVDGYAHRLKVHALNRGESESNLAVLVAGTRPDGGILVLGRGMDEITALRRIVLRALALGVLPTIALALLAGTLLSLRALRRVKTIHQTINRVMHGYLHERLPHQGTHDDLDQLAVGVNRMLDEIVRLVSELKSVGDNIAHDLRTPLSVMRVKLERGLAAAPPGEALHATIQSALADLDRVLVIITALLRIAEIENNNRRTGFQLLDLNALVAESHELYEPLAEAKAITFTQHRGGPLVVLGDHDLLTEALTNLIENAIKFTPDGGVVQIAAFADAGVPVIRVADSGPGIAPSERGEVLKRFYRSDKSRHQSGYGLGLSLVHAIITLHGFRLRIGDNQPGTVIDLICGAADGAPAPE
ncbi:MAG: ATP-binding protein [Acetobacteraceae bacterium]